VGWDGVLVVGATNCPEALDPALTRPGRLSTLVHVPPPSSVEDREAVLAVHFRKVRGAGVDRGGSNSMPMCRYIMRCIHVAGACTHMWACLAAAEWTRRPNIAI
jgi:hypothetical protein